jgi:isopentenyl-diphosphate delta-isomerase
MTARQVARSEAELVVLVDDGGRVIGSAPKATVHHRETPLHLAFSCYVFDEQDRLLVTRRAEAKRTWPGVWTNSLCGHPGPGEPMTTAITRRARQELGLALTDIKPVLPDFRYRAVMVNGVVENEICPVFTGRADADPTPAPAEVESWEWIPWAVFADDVLTGRRAVSPWCVDQVLHLSALATHPCEIAAPAAAMPPAVIGSATDRQ